METNLQLIAMGTYLMYSDSTTCIREIPTL